MRALVVSSLPLLLLTACPAPGGGSDAGVSDAGIIDRGVDGGADAGVVEDAGSDAGTDGDAGSDAGTVDDGGPGDDGGPSVPAPGFGEISGPCGVLDEEITSPSPAFFANRIDFGDDPYDDADYPLLSEGGQEMIDDGNAGGSSLLSEVFSYEMLHRCEGATLLKTETEIAYVGEGSITDLLVELDGEKVGVSVVRAVAFPFDDPYTVEQATTILVNKLEGIQESSANVDPGDAWVKQILYVIAYGEGHAASLEAAYAELDPALLGDTIVMVTVSDGDDDFLY